MANRTRKVQLKFWVTEEERAIIERKMEMLKTKNMGAYLRKMAIDELLDALALCLCVIKKQ